MARGHDVAIAVINTNAKKPVGLEGCRLCRPRSRARTCPAARGHVGPVAHGLRGVMDFVRYLHPRFAAARRCARGSSARCCRRRYHWIDAIPQLAPSRVHAIERALWRASAPFPCAGRSSTSCASEPDVMLVSPLIDAASEQVDWIKAARACGIRSAACIASWDNLTNKGLMRVEPDLVVVWNEAQKQEAHEYHYIPSSKIVATGAQLFDKWFLKRPTRDRAAFCARVGLPDTRPFLLFTGSSSFISESRAEVAFVRRWIAALRASGDPTLRDINILVRPHPYNCHAWDPDPLTDLPGRCSSRGAAITRSIPTTAPTSSIRFITPRQWSASTRAR